MVIFSGDRIQNRGRSGVEFLNGLKIGEGVILGGVVGALFFTPSN